VGEAKSQAPKGGTAAIAFARLGGLNGGVARAASVRKRIAKNAAEARWKRKREIRD
jgi:hypothetical protein